MTTASRRRSAAAAATKRILRAFPERPVPRGRVLPAEQRRDTERLRQHPQLLRLQAVKQVSRTDWCGDFIYDVLGAVSAGRFLSPAKESNQSEARTSRFHHQSPARKHPHSLRKNATATAPGPACVPITPEISASSSESVPCSHRARLSSTYLRRNASLSPV